MRLSRLKTFLGLGAVSAVALGSTFGCANVGAHDPTATPTVSTNPVLVPLKDGPAGIPGSRFDDPDVVVDLTASVFQWEVYEGERVEVWGYNEQYPGPEIRVKEGDKVRVNVTNNLPEDTGVHWHGLEVPNDQDGVPGITQPPIKPGETWTYEFMASDPGTTMYHTHTHTVTQLARGGFGPLIVEPRDGTPEYDRQYTLMLHEIEGLYTINGHSYPQTLESSLLKIREGEKILVRMVNVGQQHHPMHLHGHQFKVVQLDGNPLASPHVMNTQDIAPGQTVDVEIEGNNPGTWVFHCHIIPHVTNRGEYPGGMLVVLDYEDHTSWFEANADNGGHRDSDPHASPTPAPSGGDAASVESGPVMDGALDVMVKAFDLGFDKKEMEIEAGEWMNLAVQNIGALPHDLVIEGTGIHLDVHGIGLTDELAVRFNDPGTYVYYCSIPGHRGAGMEGTVTVR
ncbi:MAG: multicopper oxidase domain-containing protein [Dehalococcoidia bacterium]